MARVFLLDNYDSFTFNLEHYLIKAGAEVIVKRNDEVSCNEIEEYHPDAILTGPGPCSPAESGILMEATAAYCGKLPMLGVCLGMQAIGVHFGWELKKAKSPVHGKSSEITHTQNGIFQNIPSPMQAGRYHSLIIKNNGLKDSDLLVTGECDGEVMAVQHVSFPLWGVQFHPESILTPFGQQLIDNWVDLVLRNGK